jgi:acetyltransferase-like isoleucine patch superfamily enzyme
MFALLINFYKALAYRLGGHVSPLLSDRKDLLNYDIGRWSYGNLAVVKWNRNGTLKVGNFCSFADNTVVLLGGEHDTSNISTFPLGVFLGGVTADAHERTKGDVIIGNDVWVGRNSTILSGVRIGDGAVIGAHSLVTQYVPDYAIVAGNPARLIRLRFARDIIESLLIIKWWTWPDEKVRKYAPLLLSNNIEALVNTEMKSSRSAHNPASPF